MPPGRRPGQPTYPMPGCGRYGRCSNAATVAWTSRPFKTKRPGLLARVLDRVPGTLARAALPRVLLVAGSPEWPQFKSGRRLVVASQLRNYPRGGKPLNISGFWARAEWPVRVSLAGTGVPFWGVLRLATVWTGVWTKPRIWPPTFTFNVIVWNCAGRASGGPSAYCLYMVGERGFEPPTPGPEL
jgi:hypothetical protein